MKALGRLNADSVRIFPSPAQIIDGDTPWLTRSSSPLRWFANRSHHVHGLVWLAAAAARNETEGQISRADFYWSELQARATRFLKVPVVAGQRILRETSQLSGSCNVTVEQAPGRLVDELLIDLHCALHNAYVASDAAHSGQRAQLHLRHIQRWLPASGMTPADRAAFIRPLVFDFVEASRAKGDWQSAASHWRDLLALDSADAEAESGLIEALLEQGTSLLNPTHGEIQTGSASPKLTSLITDVERICSRSPDSADAYDALAGLHLVHAIAQAQDGYISAAMTSAERALALQPSSQDAQHLCRHLRATMTELQDHVRKIEEQLRRHPGYVLSEQGEKNKREAKSGTSNADLYRASDEARTVAAAAAQARRRRFWKNLGLAWPATMSEDECDVHDRLLRAVDVVLERKPQTIDNISQQWAEICAKDPSLASLDAARIRAYLASRAFDTPWQPARASSAAVAPIPIPPLPIASTPTNQKKVSFIPWLYSRHDRRLKAQIAACIGMIAMATVLVARESGLQRQRDQAYRSVAAASIKKDDAVTMRAAADYLQIRPFAADRRRNDVINLYREALVRWTLAQEDWGVEQQKTVDRYRTLMAVEDGA